MGVRLVRHGLEYNGGYGTFDHEKLNNRDIPDQHPIKAITGLQEELDKKLEVIDFKTKGADSLYLNYSVKDKLLSGHVIVMPQEDNDLRDLDEGLYVPPYIGIDTESILIGVESSGESLKEIYDNGFKFEHDIETWSDRAPVTSEKGGQEGYDAWYWDESLQSFVQPNNTSNLTGFITKRKYDNYTHEVTLTSSSTDDDFNGVIIGAARDANGRLHTLMCGVDHGSGSWCNFRWGIVYNYGHPGQEFIYRRGGAPSNLTADQMPQNRVGVGWNGQSVRIKITKSKNIVTCMCSNWDSTSSYNENTKLTLNLNNYSWGSYFSGRVMYGYANWSQPKSYFKDPKFYSRDCAAPYTIQCSLRLSSQSGNIAKIKSDGLYVPGPKDFISSNTGNILTKDTSGKLFVDRYGCNGTSFEATVLESENISQGDFVYYDRETSRYKKAVADDESVNVIGIVSKKSSQTVCRILTDGFYNTTQFSGYTYGFPLYLSPDTAGGVTQVRPAISKCVGYPVPGGIVVRIGGQSSGSSTGGSADAVILECSQVGHGFAVGEAVYLASNGSFKRAVARDSVEIDVVGIVSKVEDTSNFVITTYGHIKTDAASLSSFDTGITLYLSESTAGALTDTTKTFTKPVAIRTEDGLQVLIQRADMKVGIDGGSGASISRYTDEEITEAIDSLWSGSS